MNKIEPGNTRRPRPAHSTSPHSAGNPSPRSSPGGGQAPRPRKKKKKLPNILPAVILGIVGVVIIALIIMGFKALFANLFPGSDDNTASSSILDSTPAPSAVVRATPTPTPTLAPAKEADITGKEVVQFEDRVIVGDAAYDYYKFDKALADRFTAAINDSAATLPTGVKSYSVVIPSAVDIMLPLSFLDTHSDKTSDQAKAIKYVSDGFNKGTEPVLIYDILKAHCNEALYFRTDNHWTSLAGYYAYSQWAGQKGITPPALSAYEKSSYDNFRGNQYTYTGHSALEGGESIEYYKPKAKLSAMNGTGDDASEGSVFADVTEADSDGKYSVFLGGSRAYTKISNADKTDGSACVMVIDSNGTVLAPYISENYQDTYVVDYREYEGSLTSLVADTKATDVIYCTSIVATCADSLVENLEALS